MRKLYITNKYRLPLRANRYQMPMGGMGMDAQFMGNDMGMDMGFMNQLGSGWVQDYLVQQQQNNMLKPMGNNNNNNPVNTYQTPNYGDYLSNYSNMPINNSVKKAIDPSYGAYALGDGTIKTTTVAPTAQDLTPTIKPGGNVTLKGTKGFSKDFTGGQSSVNPMSKQDMYLATHDLDRGDEALGAMLGMVSGGKKGGPLGAITAWGTSMFASMAKDQQQRDDHANLIAAQEELKGKDLTRIKKANQAELDKFIVT